MIFLEYFQSCVWIWTVPTARVDGGGLLQKLFHLAGEK